VVSETGNFGTGTFTTSLTGLSVNTRYDARAFATSSAGTGYDACTTFWTLANVPADPTVSSPAATTLDVTVNNNGNPTATTQYAISESSANQYVQATGTLSATTGWQSEDAWGSITVTGLETGSIYTFCVKARNGALVETAFSGCASGTTCTNPTSGAEIAAIQTTCYGDTPGSLHQRRSCQRVGR